MAIALVQTVQGNGGNYTNSYTKSITPTAGNLLTICLAYGSADNITITDNKGNSWQVAKNQNLVGQREINIAYVANCAGGATTISITADAGQYPDSAIIIQEWSGVAVSPLDKTVGANTTSGTTYATGNAATTAQADELLLGGIAADSNSPGYTGDAAFTGLITQAGFDAYTSVATQYRIVSATGAYGWTVTNGSSRQVTQALVTFKAAASSSVNPTRQSAALAVIAPVVTGAAIITAGLIAGTLAVQSPIARGGAQISAAVISRTIAVQSPTVTGAARSSPSNISAILSVLSPSVSGGDTNAQPNAATSSLQIQNPVIRAGATLSAAVQNTSLSVLTPTATGAAQTTSSAVNKTLNLPLVIATGEGSISAQSNEIALSVLPPVITGEGRIAAQSLQGNLIVLSPTVSVDATVLPQPINIGTELRNPIIQVPATLYPQNFDKSLSIHPPAVTGGAEINPNSINTSLAILPVTVTYRRIYPYTKSSSPYAKKARPYSSQNSPYVPLIRI